ncbi:MAG: RagB/SusD family nutrient uptake outer membrane protein [Gemmatimonadota bacterium]|nr:RagB/SusD family nutrient uptake outer membrane protein [Gemmatimonadota bacterium]
MMKKINVLLLTCSLSLSAGCSDYLDVNTNPNAPQAVSANLYLPAMLHWMVSSPQFDGRFVGHYTQEWISTSTNLSPAGTWGRMGYDPASDNGAQQWRDVYWSLGQNLVDMTTKAEAEQRWDLLGVALILKAWGWQALTDLHGEIVIKEAIDPSRTAFDYDPQDFAYQEVQRLLDSAVVLLQKTDGAVDASYLARGDKIYNGDRTKWLKLAHGLLALNLNHYSNKSSYLPARVIAEVDLSFASNADDALMPYPGTSPDNADRNFWGRTRDNLTLYRQTQFVVNLMNGTQFGGVVDPRMTRMLSPSPDGGYRGLDINVAGFGALTTAQQPNNFFGYAGTGGLGSAGPLASRYLFSDKSKVPFMTYAQLQFVKAEAALRAGDQGTALAAYRNAISSHIDFVNARNLDDNQSPTQISATDKSTFLASPEIIPAVLTLSHIMSQKYIAQWAWGHNEMWMDMRRFHYTDTDPVSGVEVFRGFSPPTNLYSDNGGKVVQRIRPRYNSEYVWNRAALDVIGGLALDYHTKPLWIIQP